jgi:hypothetical protein
MSESSTPPGRKAPVKDEIGLLEVLRLLNRLGKGANHFGLAKYATQYGAPEAKNDYAFSRQKTSQSILRLIRSACTCACSSPSEIAHYWRAAAIK